MGMEFENVKTKKARLHLQVASSARGFSWGDVLVGTLEGVDGVRVCISMSKYI